MSLFLKLIFIVLASTFFLYVFWKRLKEDYMDYQIFSTGFYTLFGISLGSIVASYFAPIWWFWLSLLGGLIGIFLGILRFRLKFIEVLEAGILGGLIILNLFLSYSLMITRNLVLFLTFVFGLLLILLFLLLDRHYKKFTWYKSGKIGFSGFTTAGIFFLVRSIVALSLPNMLSFVGNYEVYISAIAAFGSFLTVFNLSRLAE